MTSQVDAPDEFLKMDAKDREALLTWIRDNISPRKTVLHKSSYYLKHVFEGATGIYVTNGEFKGAMRASGYEPANERDQNWLFRIRIELPKRPVI